ncbi:MAG TPA: aminoglycoside phosphotransferase family protein [Phycisphaerae bacterium]|nr:aminoglycoside phosphotransferase family protein [Phycisphaerae bacterium]HNU45396.1 aminoglycoside phosphotransferase family protein [Phycisphaerae bacterium]
MSREQLGQTVQQFLPDAELIGAEPLPGGHIHDSYVLTIAQLGQTRRFLLQRLNQQVFPRPELLTENLRRVTTHIRRKLAAAGVRDVDRRVLTPVLTRSGADLLRDEKGDCWRMLLYIENTRTYATVTAPPQAEAAGRIFGRFQALLADLPPPPLHDTIPGFHDTPRRYAAFERAVAGDERGRASAVRTEIDFARERQALARALTGLQESGALPARVVHNDAKITNVLFDATDDEPLCVVDLDTVMPGLAGHDFGDMVRSMTSGCAEDEPDSAQVALHLPLFTALTRGYLSAAGGFLTPAERAHLVPAAEVIIFEQGLRFLTDYLQGDMYYRVSRPGHNLDRCRTQFRLLESMEQHRAQMQRVVNACDKPAL